MRGRATKAIVSVIVPTRNRDSLLQAALASIHENRSNGIELEIIVVDNGTGDDTANISAQAGARYVRSPRSGASAARNHGFQVARGDYVAFLDDDDVWIRDHLKAQVDWLEHHPDFGAVLGQALNVDHNLEEPGPPWPEMLPAGDATFSSLLRVLPQVGATLVTREAADAVGPFDETLLSDEDWDWHLRLALRARVGFAPIPCVLFRIRPVGNDDELQWMRFRFLDKVYWRNVRRGGERSPSLPSVVTTYSHHLGMYHAQFLYSAKAHVRQGRLQRARQSLGRAARVSPIHFAWSLVHDSETRQTVAAALRAGRTAAAEDSGVASVSVRTP